MERSFRVEYYSPRVRAEIEAWPVDLLVRCDELLDLLEDHGPLLRAPHSEALGSGLFELRIKSRSGIGRAFYYLQPPANASRRSNAMCELPYEPLSRDRDAERKRVEQIPGYLEARQEAAAEFRLLRQLLDARKRCGLTQEEVALRMGTTRSAISRLEGSRKHLPALSTLRRYADVLGCDVEITLVPRPDSARQASALRGNR